MFKAIKITALFIIKYLGGFWLARKLNKGNTCVLCYHGFAYKDEYKFRPKLFMRPETFAKRMQWLANSSYKLISLSEAVEQKHNDNCVVLTMDDGWAASHELVGDTLAEHKLPLMLYITSYYMKKQGVVINVALAYILWKSIGKTLILTGEHANITGNYSIKKENISTLVDDICQQIYQLSDMTLRQKALLAIAEQLKVSLYNQGELLFRMLNEQQLLTLIKHKVNVQLHTHHHCSPKDEQAFKQEIIQNIDYLFSIIPHAKLDHFCYPSGEYYLTQKPWLSSLGIKDATTVSAGMLTPTTERMQIPRFLDGEDVYQLEFEAELCGLTSLFRKLYQLNKG